MINWHYDKISMVKKLLNHRQGSFIGMTKLNRAYVYFLKGSTENWSTENEQKNLEKAREYSKRQEYQEQAESQKEFQQKLPWVKTEEN